MKLSLEELLQTRRYDFRMQAPCADVCGGLPDFKDRYWKALHSSREPVRKIYTEERIRAAVELTELLHSVAAFYGGLLECSAYHYTMYHCVLSVEPPLVFVRGDREDKMAVLLHHAVRLSEQFFLDIADDGWLQMRFRLNLTDTASE